MSLAAMLLMVFLTDSPWPDYRGPQTNGHAFFSRVPVSFSEDEGVEWKVPIPGRGWSTPVILGSRVWLTTATEDGKEQSVIAVDLETGEKIIDRVLWTNEEPFPIHDFNSYASPSPVVSKDAVYVHFGAYGTAKLDPETGETIWERRDLKCRHLAGPGSSPILFEDTLILTMDGGDIQFLIALSCETGEMVWGKQRTTDFTDIIYDERKAFGTPVILEHEGKFLMISSGAQATYAYDPTNGETIWSFPYKGFSMSARPVIYEDLVIFNSGFNKPDLVAIPWKSEGVIPLEDVAWVYKRNIPLISSCVVVDDRLYMADDGGILTCLDCETGEAVWRERIGGQHCASPIAVHENGEVRIYFLNREGACHVIRHGDQYDLVGKSQLENGFMASPVPLEGGFLLRSEKHLYRIGELEQEEIPEKEQE